MALQLVDHTGEPMGGGGGLAARLTARVLDRIHSDELRDVLQRVASTLNARAAQRGLFETESPVEIRPIPDTPAPESLASVLSPSQVRGFMACPASWWFKYGLKLPDPTNAGRALGIAVHDALLANFAQKVETKEDLDVTGVLGLYNKGIAEQLDKAELTVTDNIAEIRDTGRDLVQKYMLEEAANVDPAAVEISIDGEIGGVKVRGRLDLLETNGTIRDVKTACRKPSTIDPMYRFQVATYRQLADGASGLVQLDTLVKTKTPQLVQQPFQIDGADLQLTETTYPLAQTAMRTGVYMPNRGSMFCSRKGCSYWRACEDSFGGRVSE